ncbi:MAG TPA: hypothetical protein VIU62_05730 [Chloroflexota bacterium]
MDTRDQPPTDEGGTWLQGRDILPPNIPNQAGQQFVPAPEPVVRARRPKPWSLILGVPLLIIVVLAAAWMIGSGGGARSSLLAGLPGHAAATATADPGIRAASNVGGDPLLSARIESSPPVPKAPVVYLEAQAKGDGQTAWNELSTGAQQQITQQGGSAAALTQALQQSPLPPVKQITFVGGSVMGDGREATIFVVTADVNGALQQVPYYFTVDTQGKIDEVH